MSRELTVGQVAERSGFAVSALHFYERKGLIRSHRTSGNQRRYDRDVLRRLAIVRMGTELGVPLSEVAEALSHVPVGHTPSADDWRRMSEHWHDKLNRRIVLMTRMRDELNGCIGCGCLSTVSCPLMNLNDQLAEEGSGPRRLMREGSETYKS
ncbi:redox-sensitive transcriptional activator SoxR [Devosia sp. ZB163]|uniref:redox-sensitive transcriptional activator SoxR n=1 Tax=Devosia sp. ZB163 TaxID=3025938 RepID=UPI00235EAC3D|nr:redox-sensitive transcriptional activator SoxR [Devosia sp. ZB163]MDC9825514.1 redox-sensitive transcriptional activator SoxR [Devosia sp. ZB163]